MRHVFQEKNKNKEHCITRHHYDRGLINYRQPERPGRNWEGNCERREISLVGRGREGGNNYGRNQLENRVID